MKVKMKVLSHELLERLNRSSIAAGRKQNLADEAMPPDRSRRYIVNFRFDHVWSGGKDIRLSVITAPGAKTAWLDVSPEEFAAIPEVEMSELDWEAAVCVGIPRWME